MLFNSFEFAIFLPIVFILYWMLKKNVKTQNIFLLAASYFFYAWWDWRYLSLIVFCSIINYLGGLLMMRTDEQKRRRFILTICCLVSLGVLGIFKYYDFFVTSFVEAFATLGIHLHAKTLHLILPVGISFYTFHTLSYTIDVYRRNFEPTKNIVSFFLFVSIFPLAMAGPIERATNLLPQIYKSRVFNYNQAVDGLRQILWGLFAKVVIADNCGVCVNHVFDNYPAQSGSTLLLGAIFFAFQIYGDFSGYSNMAIGIGKLLGFNFLRNFNFPYFSRDIAEFWRRWHISLTTWFRDYLYIPLGGSRVGKWKVVRNTFIIYLVSGFWHGANWTFIAWGLFHALLFVPLILTGKNRKYTNAVAENRLLPSFKEFIQISMTFGLVVIGWVFFRAETIGDAVGYIGGIFDESLFSVPVLNFTFSRRIIPFAALGIFVCLFVEWRNRNCAYGLEKMPKSIFWRWSSYAILSWLIVQNFGSDQPFIYFQF